MRTLVLLHAFPVDSRMWDQVRTALDGVAEVLTPDQRGFGLAALPDDEPNLDAVADDVLRLLDERGVEQAVIGGCSMGGYVAMAVLRRAPHRVSGLVLVDTRHDADDPDRVATRLAMADRAESTAAPDADTAWVADTVLPGLLAAGTPDTSPELAAELRAMITDQSPAAIAWAQRAMAARPDATDALRAHLGPALVIVGERDVICPPELARQLTALLSDGELVVLPDRGHLTPVEAPDEVAAAITTWLASLPALA